MQLDSIMQDQAAARVQAASHKEDLLLIAFEIENEHFATPIEAVREVLALVPVTLFPVRHPGFDGVVNLRGSLIPLVPGSMLVADQSRGPELEVEADQTNTRILVFESTSGTPVAIKAMNVRKCFVTHEDWEAREVNSELSLVPVNGTPARVITVMNITQKEQANASIC